MKNKLFFMLTILMSSLCLHSCSSDEEYREDSADYYVKYGCSQDHFNRISYISVTTENGQANSLGTYGPVKKGFRAGIIVQPSHLPVRIYVAKGSDPFTLKAEGKGGASYVIE